MLEEEQTLTIEELAARAEVSVRTIRFYIAEGLLPGPGARGKAASYTGEHLQRLRLIRRLAEQRVPLAEMRAMLARLSPQDEQALLNEEEERAVQREQAAQSPSPREYLATLLHQARAARQPPANPPGPAPSSPAQAPAPTAKSSPRPARRLPSPPADIWQRWELAPGVELHVRADVADRQRQLIERLLWAAGPRDPQ